MRLQITSLNGFIIALVAKIRLLSNVLHNVALEMTSPISFIIALVARK